MNTSKQMKAAAALLLASLCAGAQTARISVAVDHPAHIIPSTLWGVFFEDINLSADGGIYPELVQNRSFEDASTPEHWTFNCTDGKSTATISGPDYSGRRPSPPLNPINPHSLHVQAHGAFSLENDGYWGMNMVKGDHYTLKFAARTTDGFNAPLTARIVSSTGAELASGQVEGVGSRWRYYTLDLAPSESDPKAKLVLSGSGEGSLFLDMVSLMPQRTWKSHGLRVDLAESLNALKPAFMRFPGGCWVEGDDMAHMYHWKNTIGDIDARIPLWNIWRYNATHGLGFHEYLQLCEDLGATPLFDINCGMSHRENIPLSQMGQWVQDALDAIEYANGPADSFWGGQRAKAGHPGSFHLKYLEIGNENGGPAYRERWPLFVNAIRAKHPEIQFVANHWQGGYPSSPQPDVVDEHFYDTPEWFMRNATHFDKYSRTGPKIFVGEYAVTRNCGLGNLRGAIGEAAFMTGLERNSDVVVMASYAPLFVNLNHRAWNPDLINFDSSKWYGLPSYYVQQMFSANRGDVSLPVQVQASIVESAPKGGMIGVGTWNTSAEFKDIKVTSSDGKILFESNFSKGTDDWKLLGDGANWKVQDGVLRQTGEREFIRALAGQRDWMDYTMTLKARKISGAEGFLILFRINGDEDRTWWNIGGWNNTADAIEAGETLDSKESHIETGHWYDLKVVLSGKNVKCYLDGQLIHDLNYEIGGNVPTLYAAAATENVTGDVIVKVVNASEQPLATDIDLAGATHLTGKGLATCLTSESATDENSLENPTKVSPKSEPVQFSGTAIKRSFPGNSLTVLRLKTKN